MEAQAPSSAAAMALRDSFGDRKIPDISRKITACVACRKQKIKCHMSNSQPPCTRCRKRGLSCTVNKSLQMLLENDVSWKELMDQRMQNIEQAMDQLAHPSFLQDSDLEQRQLQPPDNATGILKARGDGTTSFDPPRGESQCKWEVVIDPTRGPGAIPASCVSEVSTSPSAGPINSQHSDIVSQGLISLNTAEKYFSLYHQHLDHFVYNVLAEQDSLASIRARSSLLVAVVCTVSALHSASADYEICYQSFKTELSTRMFDKDHSFDDVRALCIGAFWLSDMSWSLVGAAVRIATEINLHRCITKIPHVKKACYVRTRLYFCVYIVDHYFSIAYGRPPMTREFDLLSSPTAFLRSEYATENDARLISQLELWSINSRIFDSFGVDPELAVHERQVPQLQRLSIALETWRADWNDRFSRMERVDKTDVGLHFHFAKLYLCSHVFRGPPSDAETRGFALDMEEFANSAIFSACSILRVIATDDDIQSSLRGLPAYFDTMMAFAAVFLLKLIHKTPPGIKIDKGETVALIEQLVVVLKHATSRMHSQHLLSSVAGSIEKLLEKARQSKLSQSEPQTQPAISNQLAAPPRDQDWFSSPSDAMFLGNYDFLWPQDIDLDFDFSNFDPIPLPT